MASKVATPVFGKYNINKQTLVSGRIKEAQI